MSDTKHGGLMSLGQAHMFVSELVRAARSGGDQTLDALSSRLFMALICEYDRGFHNGWKAGQERVESATSAQPSPPATTE